MNSLPNKFEHTIGHDADIYDLRVKYYAQASLVKAKASQSFPAQGSESLVILDELEANIPFKCLTHPCSYFSSSLPETTDWQKKDWKKYFSNLTTSKQWDLARLLMITDSQLAQLKSLCRRRLYPVFIRQEKIRVIDGAQNWDTYVATRSASFNRNQRRCLRNMEKAGYQYTQDFNAEEILELFSRRADQGHATKIGTVDYTVSPEFKGFTTELKERFEARGLWYQAGVRSLEGKLVACAFGMFDASGAFYIFQTAHDPALRSLRLGHLAFEKIIEDLLTRGVRFISFMGDSPYMVDFTELTHNFNRLDIHNHTKTGWLLYSRRIGSKFKKITTPAIERAHQTLETLIKVSHQIRLSIQERLVPQLRHQLQKILTLHL